MSCTDLRHPFTGEGPNPCRRCGHALEGTNHWDDGDGMPFVTCEGCGLHYVVEPEGIAIYINADGGIDFVEMVR